MDKDEKERRLIEALILLKPSRLETIDELAVFLEEVLHGPYAPFNDNGVMRIIHIRALVASERGLRIEIYPNEHPPPHFHVRSANVDASFSIEDCSLLEGRISKRDFEILKCWHRDSKEKLIKKWDEMRPTNCSVGKFRRK